VKFAAVLPLLLIASCAPVDGAGPTGASQARLASALEGLQPSAPRRCLPRTRQYNLDFFDRRTILFRSGRNIAFRADFPNGCGSLDGSRTIAYQTVVPGEICRGDIVRVLDQVTGSVVGSCAFPEFVPYVRPGSRADPRGS